MKILIMGAGAMGSLFAWHLVNARADVVVFDPWEDHVNAINRDGLRITTKIGEERIALRAFSDPAGIGNCDIVIPFVKTGQTRAMMRLAVPVMTDNTLVATFQNGIGNVEAIRSVWPAQRIAYGLTTLTSELHGPGHIEASLSTRGESFLWVTDGVPQEPERRLCHLLSGVHAKVELDDNIDIRIWKKLVINCCYNPVCALFDCSVGDVIKLPSALSLFEQLTRELTAAAIANGVPLSYEKAMRYLAEVGQAAARHVPSMVMDLRMGKATEIDALNAAVVALGEQHGIATAGHRVIVDLIRMKECLTAH
ncbi:MAG: ketopantoate reductase family protein [Loktanella sp.]|nr:ketopantoate reductase family protein [Loktanella sp.]